MKLLILLLLPFGLFAQNWQSPLNWLNGAPVPPNVNCLGTNSFSQIVTGTACSGDVTTFPSSIFSVSNQVASYATGQTPNLIYGTDSSGVAGLRNLIVQQLPGAVVASVPGSMFSVSNNTATYATGQVPNNLFGTDINGNAGYIANPMLSVLLYGALGNGTTDNTAFLTAAFGSIASGGSIYFPCGNYKVNSALAQTIGSGKSVSWIGAGQDCVNLIFSSNSGITVTYQGHDSNFHVSGMTVLASQNNTGTAFNLFRGPNAIDPDSSQTTFQDVNIRGVDGYAQFDSWAVGIAATNISNLSTDTLVIFGSAGAGEIGVNYQGYVGAGSGVCPGGACYAVVFNMANSNLSFLNNGFVYGSYVQGVNITQSNFTGDNIPINIPGSEAGALVQLTVTNSQLECNTTCIAGSTALGGATITGNTFLATTGNGINARFEGFSIANNNFSGQSGSTANAILLTTGTCCGSVNGNSITNNFGTGISLQSGSSRINVTGNSFDGLITSPIFNGTTADNGNLNWIHGNSGVILAGNIAPTFPTSGTIVTNQSGNSIQYIISGGAVSAVAIDGVSFGIPMQGVLDPSETIQVSYTGSPNWVWIAKP